jgi:SpoVK/Ycf46/Vps4 family AAA+-type ATPase
MNDIKDLELILLSKTPLVVIESFEEKRALDMLAKVAVKRFRQLFVWSVTAGLQDSITYNGNNSVEFDEPEAVLKHLKTGACNGVVVLCDFHPYLEDPKIRRLLKDIAFEHERLNCTVVLLSHQIDLPVDLNRMSARFQFSLPSEEEIHNLVLDEAREWAKQNKGIRVQTDSNTLSALVQNLRGLSLDDAKRLVRGAIVDDGAICEYNIKEISKAKFELLNMESILSYEYDTAHFSEVGGLSKLKKWLSERKKAFLEPSSDLDTPKGLLLLGVQGGGKSLAAKAVAGMWQVPLLRLDMGALYNKYIGETERNLRETLKLADHIAPCVLWMDEIEKGIGQGSSDNGTSMRVLASLLTWMAERKTQVFIVATANDIKSLPTELMRKGRMDEIFFVDLPKQAERETITLIHLEKRDIPLDKVDVAMVAQATEGFTGAEIEQAIVSTLYRANVGKQNITTLLLLDEIHKTRPISITRAEDIYELRSWAKERAVSAH